MHDRISFVQKIGIHTNDTNSPKEYTLKPLYFPSVFINSMIIYQLINMIYRLSVIIVNSWKLIKRIFSLYIFLVNKLKKNLSLTIHSIFSASVEKNRFTIVNWHFNEICYIQITLKQCHLYITVRFFPHCFIMKFCLYYALRNSL